MGLFHVQPSRPLSQEFILLSPINESGASHIKREGGEGIGEGLKDYQANNGGVHWWFCETCSVRCFAHRGPGEIVSVDLDHWKKNGGERISGSTKVWALKEGNKADDEYLSVNAVTLDAGQDGLDLREWHERKWICYGDYLHDVDYEEDAFGRPPKGGTY
jgi:hypothetical protein